MSNKTNLKLTASGDRDIVMTQVLNAPPRQVFDALTKPELMRRWFGPPGWSLALCEVDLEVGGAYRFVWKQDDGIEMGMGGTYREIDAPGRLVHTEAFDVPWYPGIAVLTTTLSEQPGGKTDFKAVLHYETKDARDMVLGSNMEQGVAAVYDRLHDLLAELQATA